MVEDNNNNSEKKNNIKTFCRHDHIICTEYINGKGNQQKQEQEGKKLHINRETKYEPPRHTVNIRSTAGLQAAFFLYTYKVYRRFVMRIISIFLVIFNAH